jgi:hypothetical protein
VLSAFGSFKKRALTLHNTTTRQHQVRPAQLPALIKNNLCAELLAAIFRALAVRSDDEATARTLDVLESVAKAKRFDQTLMFLDDKELEPLKAVLASLRTTGREDGASIDRVSKLYRL